MELNEILHGFKIERIRRSEELKGTLYEMRHMRTGAELAFLDNKEDNKLFSVAFKTLPWDDTGVFHILEHSVLAGSENYPVKEPFLDLLKSSMNTFLNAMTFPDKTMYPVSSRNEQDFINLTRVYLDAVFKPAIYHNESIFRQEGWHYEPDEDGNIFYNGVVFNEMKGALGSVDGQIELEMNRALFPDSIYGFESGGDPASIPDLTYESFLSAHSEFYSPSNAKIYLDGNVPLDRVLKIIDEEYLGVMDFTVKDHPLEMQKSVPASQRKAYYEIGKDESEENKTQVVYGKVFANWEERKRIMAYSLISSFLAGSNEAPLKRAVLEKGLAQDVEFSVLDGIAQPFYSIVFRNTNEDKKDEIKKVYTETLERLVNGALDKEELEANLNQFEFALRETEEPAGLFRNINALNSWLYGGDMLLYIENNAILRELREEINTDYYEGIIKELLDFSDMLTIIMLPSKTKGNEDREKENSRVKAEWNAFDESERQKRLDIYEKMRAWQSAPDSPEAKATLPVLALSDVDRKPMWTDTEISEANGIKLLYHNVPSNGIVYAFMYYDISDFDDDTLRKLSFLSGLFGLLPTERHTPSQLQKEIKKNIGAIDFTVDVMLIKDSTKQCKVYFNIGFCMLENRLEEATALIREILLTTKFDNKDIIRENLLQGYEKEYQSIISAGHNCANKRVLANSSAVSAVKEITSGYDYLCYLKEFSERFDEKADGFIAWAEKTVKELFVSSRLILSHTCENRHPELGEIISTMLPEGSAVQCVYEKESTPPVKEAILIPAGVSFASYGSNIKPYGFDYNGRLNVTSMILTFGYLWNEVRVLGGAYGCGFRAGRSGNVTFHSYRDPNPLGSIKTYKNTSDFIKELVSSDEDTDKYIISSIASMEGLLSAVKQGYVADANYLSGITFDDKQKTKDEMLTFKKEDLLELCDLFDKMREGNSICIVGNEDALKDLGEDWKIYRL